MLVTSAGTVQVSVAEFAALSQATSSLFSVSSKTPLLFQSIQPAILPAPSQATFSVWDCPGLVVMPHWVRSMESSSSKIALVSSAWASAENFW